jgi:hypothetical protein
MLQSKAFNIVIVDEKVLLNDRKTVYRKFWAI